MLLPAGGGKGASPGPDPAAGRVSGAAGAAFCITVREERAWLGASQSLVWARQDPAGATVPSCRCWRGADCFSFPGLTCSLVLAQAVGDLRGNPGPRHPSSGMPKVMAGSLHQRVPERCRLISWHGAWRRGARLPRPCLQRPQFEPLLFQGSQGTALFSSGLLYIPESYCSTSECIRKRVRARCVCGMDQGSL